MKRETKLFPLPSNLRRALAIAMLVAFQLLEIAPTVLASDLVVVVHKDNAASTMDMDQLRRIFKGDQKKWQSGSGVVVILPESGSAAMNTIVKNVFGMGSEDELAQYYMAAIFQQKITAPPDSLAAAAATAKVGSLAGAIAVVDKSAASGGAVKIIEVNGL